MSDLLVVIGGAELSGDEVTYTNYVDVCVCGDETGAWSFDCGDDLSSCGFAAGNEVM